MVKCVFCGKEESPHKGVHLITNIGNVDFYCSSKCRKNKLKMKRDKRRTRWTESYRIQRAEEQEKQKKIAEKTAEKK